MATIQRSLSTKVNDNGKSEIMLRLSLSKNDKIRIKSVIFVLASNIVLNVLGKNKNRK